MTKQVQRRRGTSTQHTSFTGAEGEISVNTTNKSIHVHDGITAGGVEAARADLANVSDANLNNALSGNTLASLTITSADINGGTIDGTTIGGTSPAIGTFTQAEVTGDLTISDKIVHSGDTNTAIRFPAADTVTVETSGTERLRVDSSGKVGIGMTPTGKLSIRPSGTGSEDSHIGFGANLDTYITTGADGIVVFREGNGAGANTERMRIDSSGNVGIGTTGPTAKLHVFDTGSSAEKLIVRGPETGSLADFSNGLNANFLVKTATSLTTVGPSVGASLAFQTSNTERMRINSTGSVGIGTSSPARRLSVSHGGTDGTQVQINGTTDSAGIKFVPVSGDEWEVQANTSNQWFVYNRTDNAFRLIIDGSGNLGLGVTPSAWYTSFGTRAIQIGASASLVGLDVSSSDRRTYLMNNSFLNSSGVHTYLNSSAATQYQQTAGKHQWFTAPSGTAGNAITFTQAMTLDASGNLKVGTTAATSARATFAVPSSGTLQGGLNVTNGVNADFFVYIADNVTQIGPSTATPLLFQTGNTERARIDASGNVGIGASLPGATGISPFLAIGANNAGVGSASANNIVVVTSNAERMRIDSSGNLLVGTTSTSYAYAGASFRWASGFVMLSRNTTSNTNQIVFFNPNGAVGSIDTSGSSTSYNTSSDYRLKENVAPMQNALDKIAQLNPVTYTWKADGSAGQGFIAHELQAVVPDCVTGEKDAVDADGNPQYQGVDTSFLVATLVKAIQEQQAVIAALEARITALEA